MESKLWYQSKTVWGGILVALAGVVTGVGQLLLGEIQVEGLLGSIALFSKGVWDVYNRYQTSKMIR